LEQENIKIVFVSVISLNNYDEACTGSTILQFILNLTLNIQILFHQTYFFLRMKATFSE